MDFKELFAGETVVKVKFKGHTTHHHLRQPTHEEDHEYRRRSANVRVRNRSIETSDQALDAPLFLYEKICTKVLIENGAGNPEDLPDEWRKLLPDRVKLEVIAAFLADVERDETETLGN